jgi:uncharacterized protein (DUF488 family)
MAYTVPMSPPDMLTIYTIGHSNHSIDQFVALLKGAGITALADVRSRPYSRYCPHFNRKPLQASLQDAGIEYVYLGAELGGKPDHPALAGPDTLAFQHGLNRLIMGAGRYRVAIMCAEKDPRHCHRTHLITPALEGLHVVVQHILADGSIVPHQSLGLAAKANADLDLFNS